MPELTGGGSPRHVHLLHHRGGGTSVQELEKLVECFAPALGDGLDCAVPPIGDPSGQVETLCRACLLYTSDAADELRSV